MANTSITSAECAWHDCTVKLLGRTIRGITAWSFTKDYEKSALYGAGSDPIDIASGNKSYSGSITVMGFELDKMNKAAQAAGYEDITELPHEVVTASVTLKKTVAGPTSVLLVRGISFSSIPHALNQNDKNRSYQLPFICMDIHTETL